ncbi:MAG: porphobilinogen synthase [Thaumarchaeota archaeon]|nr:porphobilinogen synthase [Nitrososphaerota archaeon]|tara:strand:- start:60 stop:1058 length:999 start_codon:yes stop_codon:yes gene_type:complete
MKDNHFPNIRLRRLRRSRKIRELMEEVRLSPNDLIAPLFVQESLSKPENIESLPGIMRLPLEHVPNEIREITSLGIPAVILFGIPNKKDDLGTSAFDDHGIVQKAISLIRKEIGDDVAIVTDICLCQYTTNGHCGLVNNGTIDNDRSIETLAKIAVSQARFGVDVVAPSAMMDGQVKAIREGLDDNGFNDVAIMSYSAKHASPLYTPFRDAAHSAPQFGDRKSYQLSYTNPNEAIREIELDINEGADIVMVKPAIAYLDLIYIAKQMFNVPLAAYSVSGEYALVKAASMQGMIDENAVILELLTSIKRAGADIIITYFAKQAASILKSLSTI